MSLIFHFNRLNAFCNIDWNKFEKPVRFLFESLNHQILVTDSANTPSLFVVLLLKASLIPVWRLNEKLLSS